MASEESAGGKILATAIVSLALGILIGIVFSGGTRDDSKETTTDQPQVQTVTTKAADFQVKMNALLREHAALTVPALRAELREQSDRDELKQAVDANSIAIADAINGVYKNKKDAFLELWRQHTGYYSEYLQAAINSDEPAKQAAKDKLNGFADSLAAFLTELNTELRQDDVRQATAQHGEQVTKIIDAMTDGDYATAYNLAHEAYEHMGTFADILSKAIVQQLPDKY
jgi:hypothetical protein